MSIVIGMFELVEKKQLCKAEHIQLALKLSDIPLFIDQSSKIAKILSSFEHVLNRGIHNYDHHPSTLTNHMLLETVWKLKACLLTCLI